MVKAADNGIDVTGLRLTNLAGALALLVCLWTCWEIAPAAAMGPGSGTQCGESGNEPCEAGTENTPIHNAMVTLPDAIPKWRDCYALCLKDNECTARDCDGQCEGLIVSEAYDASQTAQLLNYNVMGIYGADCIGKFGDYLDKIQEAAKAAHTAGLSLGNILAQAIVDKILDATIGAILNSLTNQICNVSQQILNSADSFVRNAICLPNININPFNFNLNLKELSCEGFSINPLTGQVNGSPISGVSTPTNIYNPGGYTSGAVTTPVTVAPTTPIVDPTQGLLDPTVLPTLTTPTVSPTKQVNP